MVRKIVSLVAALALVSTPITGFAADTSVETEQQDEQGDDLSQEDAQADQDLVKKVAVGTTAALAVIAGVVGYVKYPGYAAGKIFNARQQNVKLSELTVDYKDPVAGQSADDAAKAAKAVSDLTKGLFPVEKDTSRSDRVAAALDSLVVAQLIAAREFKAKLLAAKASFTGDNAGDREKAAKDALAAARAQLVTVKVDLDDDVKAEYGSLFPTQQP